MMPHMNSSSINSRPNISYEGIEFDFKTPWIKDLPG
jgi:hypothetical protein